jgi:hypothetical protein
MTDPFEQLEAPVEPQSPRPSFTRALRARLLDALDLDPLTAVPTIDLPRRQPVTTTTAPTTATDLAATPYLCVHDGSAAIDWYVAAFGATEQMRVVGDDGRLGHAEVTVGGARSTASSRPARSGAPR